MIFRPIRELLEEALADAVEINTMKQLEELIDAPYWEHPLQISWSCQGFDQRINSESYLICCKRAEYATHQAAGHLHGDPSKLIK